ncbi:MAG TPA: hypothetical protein VMY99_03965 [Nevskiaceae bacterium]|nr:hypothetical protein [Nevskiaceae bacterium]
MIIETGGQTIIPFTPDEGGAILYHVDFGRHRLEEDRLGSLEALGQLGKMALEVLRAPFRRTPAEQPTPPLVDLTDVIDMEAWVTAREAQEVQEYPNQPA